MNHLNDIWADVMAIQWSVMVVTLSIYGLYCWIFPSKPGNDVSGGIDYTRSEIGFRLFIAQATLLMWSAGISFYLNYKVYGNI